MVLAARHPDQVVFDPDEVDRINQVRLAHYFGVMPHQIDAMTALDVEDTLEILRAEQVIKEMRMTKAKR